MFQTNQVFPSFYQIAIDQGASDKEMSISYLNEEITRTRIRAAQIAGFNYYESESLRRWQITKGEHQLS